MSTPAERYTVEVEAANRRYAYLYALNRVEWLPGKFIFDHETTERSSTDAELRSVANATRTVINRMMVKT
jgi:hypothetical protein